MNPLLATFLEEAREQLEAITTGLLALEGGDGGAETVNALFRAFHTVKGSSGLVGLDEVATMVHAAEDVLAAVRAGELKTHQPLIDDLLELGDVLATWVDALEDGGALPDDAASRGAGLATHLRRHLGGEAPTAPTGEVNRSSLPPALASAASAHPEPLVLVEYQPPPDAFFSGVDPLAVMLALPGLVELDVERADTPLAEVEPAQCTLRLLALSRADALDVQFELAELGDAVRVRPVLEPDSSSPSPSTPPRAGDTGALARQSTMLKVAPEKVDAALTLVGELVVAKNGLYTLARRAHDEGLTRALLAQHTHIDRLATALQSAVMQMRLLPVAVVFQRFPRLVRDLGRELGKSVHLEFEGETTEADRFVIDGLAEPLTHLVRNALDHGLEAPDERRAAGKPPEGKVVLSARQDGERLVIALEDDGRGIDPRRVGARAVERGLVDAAALARLSDAEVCDFIFAAGFSTAATVTNVSGRGVGMDVVRRDVEGLGGRVAVTSNVGRGTRVELVLPISMAVSRVLVVRAGDQTWGLPFLSVEGVLKAEPAGLQHVGATTVLRWQGALVPVVPLAAALERPHTPAGPGARRPIIVTRLDAALVGFEVDGIEGDFTLVVKPLVGPLANTPGVMGSAILGDGQVLLVLEPEEVARWQRPTAMAA